MRIEHIRMTAGVRHKLLAGNLAVNISVFMTIEHIKARWRILMILMGFEHVSLFDHLVP